jgi:prolyl oligopeptidase
VYKTLIKTRRQIHSILYGSVLVCIVAAGFAQTPPLTPARPVVDNYFGREIIDPYRWLENLKDPKVVAWLNAQNDYTRSIIDKLAWRDRILDRIRELDRLSPPPVKSLSADGLGRYYFIRNGPDGIPRGIVRDSRNGIERIIVDPKDLKPGSVTLTNISPSPDGRYVAFVVRESGEPKLYTAATDSGRLIGAPVTGILGFTGLDWDVDSRSLYIVKLPRNASNTSEAFLNSASYRHVIGADPSTDRPVVVQGKNIGFELKETSWPFVFPLPDNTHLAVWIEDGTRPGHALYVAKRSEVLAGKGSWRKLADFEDGATQAVFHDRRAYMVVPRKTDGQRQIVSIDIASGDMANSNTISIPDNVLIESIQAAADALYVTATENAAGRFYRVTYDGRTKRISPPVDGNTEAVLVTSSRPGGLFRISSWTEPEALFDYSPSKGWTRSGLQQPSSLGKALDLIAEQVSAKSHDGVEIPLTIIHKRGLKRDGSNPTYIVGYGSYGSALSAEFDNVFAPWFEAGGVLAYAHVRGGGELGEAWHLAGSRENKRNTWLDFIACAEYLINQKYASPAKLAGGGTSAGGILVGRAITERPDLFRAALISVGTTDMLRAEYQMNGPANVAEFGTVKDQKGFEQLLEMSAYHHLVKGKRYPAVLLTTGMRDPNVDVWQPAKMTAILQSMADADRPVLLRVDPDAGHDHWGSTRGQMQAWRADQIAFLMWQLAVSNYGGISLR